MVGAAVCLVTNRLRSSTISQEARQTELRESECHVVANVQLYSL